MNRSTLPTHPHLVHPHTGEPLQAVMLGKRGPVWPVMGAAEGDDPPDPADPPKVDPPDPTDPPKVDPAKGYPEGTPVAEMTDKEQAAYWKFHSRKHESRLTALGDYSTVQQRLALAERLEHESLTEHERDVEEAKKAAKAEAAAELIPELVEAAFERQSAGRLNAAGKPIDVSAIVAGIDSKKYLGENGRPDAAKVKAYLDSIAPLPEKPSGPPTRGLGNRGLTPGAGGAAGTGAGADLFASRHKNKQTSSTPPTT